MPEFFSSVNQIIKQHSTTTTLVMLALPALPLELTVSAMCMAVLVSHMLLMRVAFPRTNLLAGAA